MHPFQFLRSWLFLFSVPFVTCTVCILAIIETAIFKSSTVKTQRYPRSWARILLRIAGIRVRVTGMENLDPKATYVFAGNHTSQLDIYSFQAYSPHDFRWIAKKELFNIPLFGLAMRTVGFIAIDRSRGREALKSLSQAAGRISDGSSVLIFPEGTRSRDGRLHPFKAGAILLAIKSGVPVVPIGFNNASRLLPKGSLLPKSGEIVLRIGTPIPTTDYKSKDKQKLALLLHDRVAQLLDEQHLPREKDPGRKQS